MNDTMYTEDDLHAAWHAYLVDMDAAIEEGANHLLKTDEQKVYWYESSTTMADLNDPEDLAWFEREVVPKEVERYHRGKDILETCKLLSSHRSVVLGSTLYNEMVEGETIVSPVIVIPSGHIATSEAYRYTALALRTS